jgi:CheY-like chemotaxis protein
MTRASTKSRRLRVIDPSMPAAPIAELDGDNGSTGRAAADDLISLRGRELRGPLAIMVGFAELIDSGDLTDDQRQLYTGILIREGRRLTALINNALALQRLETGHQVLELAPVDLRSLIHRAVVGAGVDDQRPISVHAPGQLPLVAANAEAILEVLMNFLANARAFSPHGGAITIAARRVGEMVEVSIRDHGIGIEAEALPNLFRKFYRGNNGARRRAPGAGLSLALNHRIIEAHGGQVMATSKGRGKGAQFQFTLPISRSTEDSSDILIVEDDAGFASLMKAEFAAEGFSSVRAADAETAEHLLEDMTPRAMILDLALPGLQGEDFLARTLAGGTTRLPIVVVTAKPLKPAEITALETAGALAVLPKEAGAPQAAVSLIAEALSRGSVAK